MVRDTYNMPVIIKYPFWQMTDKNPETTYACVNYGDTYAPDEIKGKAILINGDIGDILDQLEQQIIIFFRLWTFHKWDVLFYCKEGGITKQYKKALIINAPATIDSYYTAKVRYDMPLVRTKIG